MKWEAFAGKDYLDLLETWPFSRNWIHIGLLVCDWFSTLNVTPADPHHVARQLLWSDGKFGV